MDNVDVNSFDPCGLELATTYYWRIDEVNGPNTVKGDVWSFTTWLEPNLIAWWKFDEGQGLTAYDSAGNNDGTLTNGPMWTASGIDGSLIFDGVDDYVDISLVEMNNDELSICAWIRTTSTIVQDYVAKGASGESVATNTVEFGTNNHNTIWHKTETGSGTDHEYNISTSIDPVDGEWHFVCHVIEPGRHSLHMDDESAYVNGSYVNSDSTCPTKSIGQYGGGAGYFDGTIDDVRVYNRALSAEEIEQIYQSATPVNYYYVNGVDGDDLNDGQTPETAFETIQTGIDAAEDGDTVLVYPDLYLEELDFDGKAITVAGCDEPPVLTAPSFYAVSFFHGEDADSIFRNFIIKDSYSGFLCLFASPTISNVTVVDCNNGVIADEGSNPIITNSIIWNNTGGGLSGCEAQYSLVQDAVEDGLVAHWKFDEGTGLTAYDSAGTNHGTLVNVPEWTTGVLGGALDFDGVDDYVEIPDADSLTPTTTITISFWIRNRGGRDGGVYKIATCPNELYSPGNSRAYWLQVYGSTGKLELRIHSSATSVGFISSNSTIPLDEWRHVTGTFNAGSAAVYIDGKSDNSGTLPVTSIMNDAQPLTIGSFWNYCGTDSLRTTLNGLIDEVAVFSRALSAEEVLQVYLQGVGPRFVDAEGGDYHLKSEGWRWAGGEVGWTWDEVTSWCVDSGNPGTPLRNEPMSVPRDPDNIWGENVRVNMGAYGGTSQASMPPHGWSLLADLNNDGVVDWLDVGLYAQCWLSHDYEPAGDLNRDGMVNMVDWALLLADWQQETIW
jgi:hypothetical protein